jgi:hypothetical protein
MEFYKLTLKSGTADPAFGIPVFSAGNYFPLAFDRMCMKRRNFLRNGFLVALTSSLPLAVSADQAESNNQDTTPSERTGYTTPDNNKKYFIEIIPPTLTIGVPENVPGDAPVYDASEYELREAPAFSEAIEQLSPDFEAGEYIAFIHYEHWQELDRHVAAHSDNPSVGAHFDFESHPDEGRFFDFESHPDEGRFFDFGDFVLNTQSGGYV